MVWHPHTHEISGRGHNNLSVCPMKYVRYWSHMSTTTTDENYTKTFCQSVHKQRSEEKWKRKKKTTAGRKTIAKLIMLHVTHKRSKN